MSVIIKALAVALIAVCGYYVYLLYRDNHRY